MAVAGVALIGEADLADTDSGAGLPLRKVPVRVLRMQSATEPALQTTLPDMDIHPIFFGVNEIWSSARMQFDVESVGMTHAPDYVPAIIVQKDRWVMKTLPISSRTNSVIDVCDVKKIAANGHYSGGLVVVKDMPALQSVPGGTGEYLARVTAHELGHALGLGHRQNITNPMASKTTGFSLSKTEIALARVGAMKRYAGKVPANQDSAVLIDP